MSVTDEIKSRIDIVGYVQRHVPTLKKAGRNHKACCPFHNEKTPSFVVNPARQTWHCFGACAEGGDLFTFTQKLHGWSFKEALRELAIESGVQLRQQTQQEKTQNDRLDRLRDIVATASDIFHAKLYRSDAEPVLKYVREIRGLSDETVETFQLGFAPESWDFTLRALRDFGYRDDDIVEVGLAVRNETGRVYDRFRNRLMIPIRDERGRVAGFGGRALDANEQAKYINSPQSMLFDKSRLLFGLDRGRAAIRDSGTAVIVEGYLDVIQAHQAGFLNVVAQMGTAMTERQIRLVTPRYANRIVLALDSDEAGQNAARRSLEVARQTLSSDYAGKLSADIRILQMPEGKDPDDFLRKSPDSWETLVDRARTVADFVIDMETASLNPASSLQERQTVAQQVLPILSASENSLYRQENIQKLARRIRVSERELLAWAQRSQPSQRAPRQSEPLVNPALDVPPEYWDNEYEPTALDSSDAAETSESAGPLPLRRRQSHRTTEPYCLSLLLKNPNLLYQVNRRLRELAGDDRDLLQGPLCEFGAADFTQSQYRELMAHLQDSMMQDDQEPLEYLDATIDSDLLVEFRALLIEEPEAVSQLMNRNYQVDLNDILKRRPYVGKRGYSLQDELISRALQLREARLENERIEMQYLQEEAQTGRDSDRLQNDLLSSKIMLSMKAKARINTAVSRNSLPLQQPLLL